jgi:hypothetical protein
MPKVFISYRREDSPGIAGRLFDRLQSHFGRGSVFIDVDSIPFGADFRTHVTDAESKCDALLAIIGERWAATGRDGRARLDDSTDPVRIEIEAALARDIPVIPVLVGRTPMPPEEELPPSLRPLAYRHACNLDSGPDFHVHVDRLIRGLEQLGTPITSREVAAVTPDKPGAADDAAPPRGTSSAWSVVEVVSGRTKGTSYELTKDRVLIGRSPDCDIAVVVPTMSNYHAQFVRTEDGYLFEDLFSRNGSYVNGQRVNDRVPLHDGDRIHTGAVILVYRQRAGREGSTGPIESLQHTGEG